MPSQFKLPHFAFFYPIEKRRNVIITPCDVTSPYNDIKKNHNTKAIWDTGATHTAISPHLVSSLKLPVVSMTQVRGVHGTQEVSRHIINLVLPNKVTVEKTLVSQLDIGNADILIGMDIIGMGDFTVCKGQFFSFAFPPFDKPINLVEKADRINKNIHKQNKKFLQKK